MNSLAASIQPVRALETTAIDDMYALFSRYYDGTSPDRFKSDLESKDSVAIIRDGEGRLCGFSTLVSFPFAHKGRDLRVVFSGDTVIDRAHWGSQAFAFAWIRHIGELARGAAGRPLYWLLIVKGHRTYRYLPAFGLRFVPDWRSPPDSGLLELRDAVASARFGSAFDPRTGIVRHQSPQGHLAAPFAEIPEREARRPDVRHFIESNPGYRNGDELVCLCELGADNMRPLTQRLFRQGFGA